MELKAQEVRMREAADGRLGLCLKPLRLLRILPLRDLDSDTLHRIYVPKWNVTNDSVLDDPYVCSDLTDRLASPTLFAQLRGMDYDQLYSEFNVGVARQVCLALLSERDAEIAHLKSLLSLKEAEAAKVICLRGQLTVMEAAAAAKVEVELASLSSQVAKLTSDLSGFQISRDELDYKVASLESERDFLVTQKNSLEYAFELFRERMEALQDEQAKIMGDRVAELDAYSKGIQDRLKARIDIRQAIRDLFVLEAYDPYAEAKYINVVNALGAVDLSLLSELESKKDSCIVDLMGSLFLEDDVVIGETSLSSSLLVVHLWAQRFMGEVKEKGLLFTNVITPLVKPLSSKSLTGEAKSHNEDPSAVTFEKEELRTSPE
nr:hypothetical protein [Tanacetum cinerariifolium]